MNLSFGDIETQGHAEQKGAGMGVAVRSLAGWCLESSLKVVVAVRSALRSPSLHQLLEIFEQQGLVLVDEKRGRRVLGVDVDEPVGHSRPSYSLLQAR